MEQILVNQLIGLEFTDKCFKTDNTRLVKSELKIDSIIGCWAIYNVIVVGEAILSSVCQHKLSPFLIWF